ncbi:MAG: response regulator [Candidatus Sericytochromatia bacterium]|nr:response regulator [Candidatus Sericytochromatia bacterium]
MCSQGPSGQRTDLAATPLPLVSPLRILLAEDEPVAQIVLQGLFQAMGHEVLTVSSGPEASLVVADGGFDLAVLDFALPGCDGLSVARTLRAREADGRRKRLPIILLSAEMHPATLMAASAAGIEACLTKPVDAAGLRQALQQLELVRESVKGAPALWSPSLGRLDDDPALREALLATFVAATPRLLADLHVAIDSGEADAVKSAAHRLLGTLRHFDRQDLIGWAQAIAVRPGDRDALADIVPLAAGVADLIQQVAAYRR